MIGSPFSPVIAILRRPLFVALAAAAAVVALLVSSQSALGVQTVVAALDDGNGSTHYLGGPVEGTITITLEANEVIGVAQGHAATASFGITGNQNVTFTLPLDSGSFSLIESTSSADETPATLTGTVTHTNVEYGDYSGYGYGYGYRAGSAGGTIVIDYAFTQRILLYPVPLSYAELPSKTAIASPISLTGAAAGQQQVGGGEGDMAQFPSFEFVGSAQGPGVPWSASAVGMDTRVASGKTIVGVLINTGDPNSNNMFAEFEIGFDNYGAFMFPRSTFSLPDTGLSYNPGASPPDDKPIENGSGLTYIDADTIAVAGGSDPSGGDAWVATYDLTTSGGFYTGANVVGAAYINYQALDKSGTDDGLFDAPAGGVEWDGDNILVIEEISQDYGSPAVVKVDETAVISDALTSIQAAFTADLAGTGRSGFTGFGGDPNSLSSGKETRFFASTMNDGANMDPPVILEFDGDGFPMGTHYIDNFPGDQQIGGIGLIDSPDNSGDAAFIFIVAKDMRDVFVAEVTAAAEDVGSGAFTNYPYTVDTDADGNILFWVEGNPDYRLAKRTPAGVYTSTAVNGIGRVAGATYVSSTEKYYVITGEEPGVIYEVDPDSPGTGTTTATLPYYAGEIGGLASTVSSGTTYLYAYERWGDTFYKVDASSGNVMSSLDTMDNNFMDQFFTPGGARAATIAPIDGTDTLVVGNFNQLFYINLTNGSLEGGAMVSGAFDVEGLGTDPQGSLLIADSNNFNPSLSGARPGGVEDAEVTAVGDYSLAVTIDNATAGADAQWGPSVTSTAATFTIDKLDAVTITITSPSADQVFSSSPIWVVGTVNDPTVTSVGVQAKLASGFITGPTHFATDTSDYTAAGATNLWSFETSDMPAMKDPDGGTIASGNAAAFYGQGLPSNPNFSTTGPNQGKFSTPAFTVTDANTTLVFDTWYATEPTPFPMGSSMAGGYDRKIVQFCTGNSFTSCDDLLHIVSFVEDPFGPMMGGMMGGMGGGMDPMMGGGGGGMMASYFEPFGDMLPPGVSIGDQFDVGSDTAIYIPRQRGGSLTSGNAKFTTVELSLADLVGEGEGKIKFAFDSVDDFNFGPDQQGWAVDNLHVEGELSSATSNTVTNGAFSFQAEIAEGENETTIVASSGVSGTTQGSATFATTLDTKAPTLTVDAVTSPTTSATQAISGTYVESSPAQLEILVNGVTKSLVKSFTASTAAYDTYSTTVGLVEGNNSVKIVLTDDSDMAATTYATIVLDNTAPSITTGIKPLLTDSGVRAGDQFFVVAAATDASTGIGTVSVDVIAGSSLTLSNTTLAPIASVPEVLLKKHELTTFGNNVTTTHVGLASLGSNTPAGTQSLVVTALDAATNEATSGLDVSIVASLTNRTAFLMPGNNYVGFPLVPSTSVLDTLLDTSVTNINPALETALGGAKLSDLVDIVYAHQGGTSGLFITYTPGVVADAFTDLDAFEGMIVNVASTVTVDSVDYRVFETGTVLGTQVSVPIKWNIDGVFQEAAPALPPSRSLSEGYNLWTPHAIQPGEFEDPGFLRAAVVTPPGNLAVSAVSQINRVDAVVDASAPGGFDAEVESRFQSLGPGDSLGLMRSYWTYMVGDAVITP